MRTWNGRRWNNSTTVIVSHGAISNPRSSAPAHTGVSESCRYINSLTSAAMMTSWVASMPHQARRRPRVRPQAKMRTRTSGTRLATAGPMPPVRSIHMAWVQPTDPGSSSQMRSACAADIAGRMKNDPPENNPSACGLNSAATGARKTAVAATAMRMRCSRMEVIGLSRLGPRREKNSPVAVVQMRA